MTVAPHAWTTSDFMYFDHGAQTSFSQAMIDYQVLLLRRLLPQVGDSQLQLCCATQLRGGRECPRPAARTGRHVPRGAEPAGNRVPDVTRLPCGPVPEVRGRRPEHGNHPIAFADYLTVQGHPELDSTFFNVITEIRDNAGYEWYPTDNVSTNISKGVAQLKRALDNRAVGTYVPAREYSIESISASTWQQSFEGIRSGIAGYQPVHDDGCCGGLRRKALHDSLITDAVYDGSGAAQLAMSGTASSEPRSRCLSTARAVSEN